MKATILLDIDGVLCNDEQFYMNQAEYWLDTPWAKKVKAPYPFDKVNVKLLNDIILETDADIVLSSDWKKHWNLEELDIIFKNNGVIKSPIDITGDEAVSMNWLEKNRALQVHDYVVSHNLERYVILEDLWIKEFLKGDEEHKDIADHVVQTNDYIGLKERGKKELALEILKEKEL